VLISADGRTGNLSSFPQWRQTLSLTYFRPQGIGIASWKIKITLTLPDSDTISKAGFKDNVVPNI
jgi:hypothetical protein